MPPRPNSQMEPSSQCAISKSPNLLGISVESTGPQSPLVAGARPIFKRQALQTPCGKSAESSLPQLLQTRCGSFRTLPPTPVDGVTWSSAGTLPIKVERDAKIKPASRVTVFDQPLTFGSRLRRGTQPGLTSAKSPVNENSGGERL